VTVDNAVVEGGGLCVVKTNGTVEGVV